MLLLAAMLAGLSVSAAAQTMLGGVEVRATAGYGGYAFPVANWGLGRSIASNGSLQWQLASNDSTIPVRIDFFHRQAIAFKGRVELSAQAYAPSEDPQRSLGVVRQEVLVPPGVPLTLQLAPRVAPQFAPGAPVELELRVYQDRQVQPFIRQTLSVLQLEPAHLYSLLLDAPDTPILADPINPDNELGLRYPQQMLGDRDPLELGLRVFNHYTIPLRTEDRGQVLGAPLAARSFAFVVAELATVRTWSEVEQQALAAFALGGGYLCLHGAGGAWQGLTLDEPQPYGRGFVLPVDGGLDEARELMRGWLEGELVEFTLLIPGEVREEAAGSPALRLNSPRSSALYSEQMQLGRLFDAPQRPASHGADYLNPIWIHREGGRLGAQQHWDYPEFTQSFELRPGAIARDNFDPLLQNTNLRIGSQGNGLELTPLFELVQPRRAAASLPIAFLALAIGATLCAGLRSWPVALRSGMLGLALAGAVWLWYDSSPVPSLPVSYELVDRDLNSEVQVERRMQAQATGRGGEFELPAAGLLRFVRWSSPASWDWTLPPASAAGVDDAGVLRAGGGGPYVAVATEHVQPAEPLPVSVELEQLEGRDRMRIDTSELPAGAMCLLLTPQGPEMLPTGQVYTAEFPAPPIGVKPGAPRLLAWQQHFTSPGDSSFVPREDSNWWWRLQPTPYGLLALALTDPQSLQLHDPLSQLAWSGLLQPLGGSRPFMQNQAVLVVPLTSSDRQQRFLRLTIPLDSTS